MVHVFRILIRVVGNGDIVQNPGTCGPFEELFLVLEPGNTYGKYSFYLVAFHYFNSEHISYQIRTTDPNGHAIAVYNAATGERIGHIRSFTGPMTGMRPNYQEIIYSLLNVGDDEVEVSVRSLQPSGDRSYYWNVHGFYAEVTVTVESEELYHQLIAEAIAYNIPDDEIEEVPVA
jgi:hypothetical protein